MGIPVSLEDLSDFEGDQTDVALVVHFSLGCMFSIGMLDGEGVRGKLLITLLTRERFVAEEWGAIILLLLLLNTPPRRITLWRRRFRRSAHFLAGHFFPGLRDFKLNYF